MEHILLSAISPICKPPFVIAAPSVVYSLKYLLPKKTNLILLILGLA